MMFTVFRRWWERESLFYHNKHEQISNNNKTKGGLPEEAKARRAGHPLNSVDVDIISRSCHPLKPYGPELNGKAVEGLHEIYIALARFI